MRESASGLCARLSIDLTSVLGARPWVALMTGISRGQFEAQPAAAACSAARTSRSGMSSTEEGSSAATCPRSRTSISSLLRPATQKSIRAPSLPEPTCRGHSKNALTPGSASRRIHWSKPAWSKARTVRPSLGLKAVSGLAPRGRGMLIGVTNRGADFLMNQHLTHKLRPEGYEVMDWLRSTLSDTAA